MKICPQCNTPQEIYQFRKLTNDICMKCESLKVYERMLKFLYTDIGLENLDKSLEEIIVKSKYLTATYTVPLEKAIKHVINNRAHVYKPDMIYRTDYEDENWIVRYEVLERDNYRCHYCGKHTDESVDHILPRSKGGRYTHENLLCCCHDCNQLRKNMDYHEFKDILLLSKEQQYLLLCPEEVNKLNKQRAHDKLCAEQIQLKKEKYRKASSVSKVLLKQKDKFGW